MLCVVSGASEKESIRNTRAHIIRNPEHVSPAHHPSQQPNKSPNNSCHIRAEHHHEQYMLLSAALGAAYSHVNFGSVSLSLSLCIHGGNASARVLCIPFMLCAIVRSYTIFARVPLGEYG